MSTEYFQETMWSQAHTGRITPSRSIDFICAIIPFRTKFPITDDDIVGEKITDEVEECTICMERNCNLVSVNCDHSFCRECIQSWMNKHHITYPCPLCRTQLETFKHIKIKGHEQF